MFQWNVRFGAKPNRWVRNIINGLVDSYTNLNEKMCNSTFFGDNKFKSFKYNTIYDFIIVGKYIFVVKNILVNL